MIDGLWKIFWFVIGGLMRNLMYEDLNTMAGIL